MRRRLVMAVVSLVSAVIVGIPPGPAAAAPPSGTWTAMPPLPAPRQEHAVVALDDKIYAIGGVIPGTCNPAFPVYCSTGGTDIFDVSTGTWSPSGTVAPLPPLPDGSERTLLHPGAAAVDGKIYVLGGLQRPNATTDFPWYAVGDSFVYDPAANTWTPIAPMPPGTERGSGAIVAHGRKIYVAGGTFCHEGFEGQCFSVQGRNRLFSVYDTVTNTWQQLADLPRPRDHVPGAAFGNSLYLFGGRDDHVDVAFAEVLAYNLKTGTWRTVAPMPTARSEAWLGVVGDQIHLLGGSGNVATPEGTFDDHEIYDVKHDRWTVLPPMPVPRHGPVTAVIGGAIYLPGGALTETLGTVDTFDRFTPP